MKVLVTGASSGIGYEFCDEILRKYNAGDITLVMVSKDKEKLKKASDKLIKKYTNVNIIIEAVNLINIKDVKNMCTKHIDADIVFNNAGFGDCGYFDKTDLDKDIDMINTNISALHIITKLFLKNMLKKNSGHIINVSSIAAFIPGPLMSTYYATKSYVLKLSQSLNGELKRKKTNVKISVLCPGPVKTNFEKNANVKFEVSKKSPSYIARYVVKNMNKFYMLPGVSTKMVFIFSRFMPTSLLSKIAFMVQKRRIK